MSRDPEDLRPSVPDDDQPMTPAEWVEAILTTVEES